MLMDTETSPDYTRAIFLDPPYRLRGRKKNLYASDKEGTSNDLAEAAYEWAVKHGRQYRIAYACDQFRTSTYPPIGVWRPKHTAEFAQLNDVAHGAIVLCSVQLALMEYKPLCGELAVGVKIQPLVVMRPAGRVLYAHRRGLTTLGLFFAMRV